jgi:hypothetical protein
VRPKTWQTWRTKPCRSNWLPNGKQPRRSAAERRLGEQPRRKQNGERRQLLPHLQHQEERTEEREGEEELLCEVVAMVRLVISHLRSDLLHPGMPPPPARAVGEGLQGLVGDTVFPEDGQKGRGRRVLGYVELNQRK